MCFRCYQRPHNPRDDTTCVDAKSTLQIAFDCGVEDYHRGLARSTNPFMSTRYKEAWEQGWLSAKGED